MFPMNGQEASIEDWMRWTGGLSYRLKNILSNLNINSREEALVAYQSGRLNFRGKGTRNYGWKSHCELARWLGLPPTIKPTRKVSAPKHCPHCGGVLK